MTKRSKAFPKPDKAAKRKRTRQAAKREPSYNTPEGVEEFHQPVADLAAEKAAKRPLLPRDPKVVNAGPSWWDHVKAFWKKIMDVPLD